MGLKRSDWCNKAGRSCRNVEIVVLPNPSLIESNLQRDPEGGGGEGGAGAAVNQQSGSGPRAGLMVCLDTVSRLLCRFPKAPVFIETSALLASSGRECRSSRSI